MQVLWQWICWRSCQKLITTYSDVADTSIKTAGPEEIPFTTCTGKRIWRTPNHTKSPKYSPVTYLKALVPIQLPQRESTEYMSGNLFFRCKSCLNNITRCFMKFEAKQNPPVVWAEFLALNIFMYWAEPPRFSQGLFSPQNTTGVLFEWCGIIGDAENRIWWNLVLHPFLHPFCWFC
jgi:hypothetical protein